jgi:hypothetical protein
MAQGLPEPEGNSKHAKKSKANGASAPPPVTPEPVTPEPVEAQTIDDNTVCDEVPASPSSILGDFELGDIEDAVSETKQETQILVDTGIEIVRVGKPKNFVAIYPKVMHGWVWEQDFDDPSKRPTHLVHPRLAASHCPPCRTVQFVFWVEPLPEDAVWPVYGVWHIKQEAPTTGTISDYSESAMAKVQRAIQQGGWFRFQVPQGQRAYSMYQPEVPIQQEPKWPTEKDIKGARNVAIFLLTKGFENRYINSVKHAMYAKMHFARGKLVESVIQTVV